MLFIEDLKGINKEKIKTLTLNSLADIKTAGNVLIIHPDYTRHDFTQVIVPEILKILKNKKVKRVDFLNAGGTHRAMKEHEFLKKLGIIKKNHSINFYNHRFDCPGHLINLGEISSQFIKGKTDGQIEMPIPVNINKLIFDSYNLIITITSTVPHEATGFSGGLKIFFPGISGPEVIDLFHWTAAIIGIQNIIGTIDNAARDILNEGAKNIFKNLKSPIISLNMVNTETRDEIIPVGLYSATEYRGFIDTYRAACSLSSRVHIKYIDYPLKQVVQVIPQNYDEIWTAGKGSYKLQKPGVMAEGAELIIYAPHIKIFHSNKSINSDIASVGYHCRDYLKNYILKNPDLCRNSAAHLINVTGPGYYNEEENSEKPQFKITLATGIPEDICKKVNLGYRNPNTLKKNDFTGEGKLWIEDGGKYLYQLRSNSIKIK